MKKNYFIKKQKLGIHALAFIFCILFVNSIEAQKNIGWKGADGANWSVASNWEYQAVTVAGFFVTSSASITLTSVNNDIAVGDAVSGYGIPPGATVLTIDAVDKKKITISANTLVAVATPGTNLMFTFATPKVATTPPTFLDIALIGNGTSPNLNSTSYSVAGLTITNRTGAISGSTLTIPTGVEFNVSGVSNECVLLKGGNIINNGFLNIINGYSVGAANISGNYGITCSLPVVNPTVPTEYTYSGSGELYIDSSAGNNFSGGIMFNGSDANAANTTYKFLFDGTNIFKLSGTTAANGTATTHFIRAIGLGALPACKVIIGGKGIDFGTESAGATNGFISVSGGGVDVTIAQGTIINIFSDAANPTSLIGMYAFGATAIPAFLRNKGTINIKGSMQRSVFGLSAQSFGVVNFVNDGVVDTDTTGVLSGNAIIAMTNNGSGAQPVADVNFINNATMSLKTKINGAYWGAPIAMTTFAGAPNLNLFNTGTLDLMGSNYSFGNKPLDPSVVPVTVTGASRITNSGTINTNQEFRAFHITNTSTGKITLLSTYTPTSLKFATLTIAATVNASVGDVYTDPNMNVHTVVLAKLGTTTTATLLTNVVYNATIPVPVTLPLPTTTVLTKVSGSGDAEINYTAQTSNGINAFFQPCLNSGVINTNTGKTEMTAVTGLKTEASTSVLSPGGDTGNGIATFTKNLDTYTFRGTLKMQAAGSTTAGVDYDLIDITGTETTFDISTATLDLTGLYTPTEATTIDIIKTNTTAADPITGLGGGGAIIGAFDSVIGKPNGWSVNYTGGIGGKVQLVFDPSSLSTSSPAFSKFKFSYYPNPSSNQVNLSAEKNISKVELFNLLGQKVLSNTVNSSQKQLNIANLQKGMYLMEVSIDNAKKTFKIIKE